MRFFTLVLAAIVVFSGMLAAYGEPCSDGTVYSRCSAKSAGFYCTGTPSTLQPYIALCKCEAVAGWVQSGTGEDATCIQAKCNDNTKNGECSATKPKVCIGGDTYADNATKCGCPSGKKASANGVFCESIPCNDSGFSVGEGECSPKKAKKCVGGQLVDKASECGCPTGKSKVGEACLILCSDGTKDGECSAAKPNECVNGVLLENAQKCGCPSGKNAVGKQCTDSILGLGGTDLLGGGASDNQSATGGASSPLSCCCLPTALIGLVGGFAAFRKK